MAAGTASGGTEDLGEGVDDLYAKDAAICREVLAKKLTTMRLRFDALELLKDQLKIGTITLPAILPLAFFAVMLHGPAAVGFTSRGAFPDSIGSRMQASFLLVPLGSWFALCQSLNASLAAGAVHTRFVPALAASTMMTDPTLRRAIAEVHAGLLPEAALPLEDKSEASGITLAEFMRHFASNEPAARLVAKTHFNLLLAEQRTELLSLPNDPEEAVEKLEELEKVLLQEVAERRRAQACMGAESESATAEMARVEARLEVLAMELKDIAVERDNITATPVEVEETKPPEEPPEFAPSSDGEDMFDADIKIPSRNTAVKVNFARKDNPFTAFHDAIEEEKTAGRQMALTDDDIRRFVSKSKSEGAQMRVWKRDYKHRLYENSKFFTALGQQVAANRLGFKAPEPVEWKQTYEVIKGCQSAIVKSKSTSQIQAEHYVEEKQAQAAQQAPA